MLALFPISRGALYGSTLAESFAWHPRKNFPKKYPGKPLQCSVENFHKAPVNRVL